MLYWKSNFQMPNSGTQCSDVYIKIGEKIDNKIILSYSCHLDMQFIYTNEELILPVGIETDDEVYDYLIKIEKFSNYIKI
jgi:hypothetical protein